MSCHNNLIEMFLGFPALVLTIKEMIVSLNLSKRLVSAGKFTGFLIRFDEQFHFRHKTWTTDPKKTKFLNYGISLITSLTTSYLL